MAPKFQMRGTVTSWPKYPLFSPSFTFCGNHLLSGLQLNHLSWAKRKKNSKPQIGYPAQIKARIDDRAKERSLSTEKQQWHPLSREHFSLKIDVRDQTIWNCILEL